MKIRPLADKVLVERVEAQSTTAGGIVLPDAAKPGSASLLDTPALAILLNADVFSCLSL